MSVKVMFFSERRYAMNDPSSMLWPDIWDERHRGFGIVLMPF